MNSWISLCAGLDASASLGLFGCRPPVTRIGGKRAVAQHVLEIIGDPLPGRLEIYDADPAIFEFWSLAFLQEKRGLFAVVEALESLQEDGEDLWQRLASEPPPENWAQRMAAWLPLQSGNSYGRPVSFTVGKWIGLAGYGRRSQLAIDKGFCDRFTMVAMVEKLGRWVSACAGARGRAYAADLTVASPLVNAGDLVTIDPPYFGTTGYSKELTRGRVQELAQMASDAGARVLIHEQRPVLSGGPWRAVRLHRSCYKFSRTFSRQQEEWVTINFEPRGQIALFEVPG